MNRAEARIKKYQNSSTQIKAYSDTVNNSNHLARMKNISDEIRLANKLGRGMKKISR